MRRVLITGSRNLDDMALVSTVLDRQLLVHGALVVVEGGATGADLLARIWAGTHDEVLLEEHPADWTLHGKRAGPIRNQEMVDAGADVCLAFPMPDSKGTFDCMRKAEAAGIPVIDCTWRARTPHT